MADKELITKPEETDEYIRIPVRGEAGKHEDHRIRTITISEKEGIKALYCGECKVVITYLFAKDHDWTMESARAWVREHSKTLIILEAEDIEDAPDNPQPHKVSQNEILDELDYLIRLIDTEGMNDEVKKDAWRLVEEVMRLTGNDIPDNIVEMVLKSVEAKTPPVVEPEPQPKSDNLKLIEAIGHIAERKLK